MSKSTIELPRENLLRGKVSGIALRAAGDEGEGTDGPVMVGHFAVFNQWTEIRSWEGNFLEMFAPRAFKKTIRDNSDNMKVLFQHGYDYMIGDKPLGPIRTLEEDSEGDHVDGVAGAWYEVPLLDAPYVRQDLMPGLEAELYGASFRFRVIREEVDEEPEPSDYNPQGLPERIVKEAHVAEFGPVTFPAYDSASSGLRSLEASELVAQAALERMERQDAELSHNLAARFATRSESAETAPPTSTDETEETEEVPTEETVESEVEKTEGDETAPESDDTGGDTQDAPPQGSAEVEPHPDRGRRDKERLYGASTAPSWRL
jgi:HK97 family phage prohead protease